MRHSSAPPTAAPTSRRAHSGLPSTSGTISAANTLTGTKRRNASQNGGNVGIGFAVPIDMVKRVLKDLEGGRPVKRGALGVQTAPLDATYQDALGVKQGVVVL